jgi:hypothetical protein
MIAKKIPFDKAKTSKSKSANITDLTDYISAPEAKDGTEKLLYLGGRGFLSEDFKTQQSEMIALAMDAPKSANPVTHWILSWREGEQPTFNQAEEAVGIFLHELGLDEHQAIYALHQNTDNIHMHIAVNRVHPESTKVIKPNKGFDHIAAMRAVALIEHHQGWSAEKNALFSIDAGVIQKRADRKTTQKKPDAKARDMEGRTGEKSAKRTGIEDAAPIIKRATSWAELHQLLAEKGMRYEKVGSGAKIFIGDVAIKASDVDRGASLGKLEKRLGPYQLANSSEKIREIEPMPISPNSKEWGEFNKARRLHYQSKKSEQDALRQRHLAERKALLDVQREKRKDRLQGSWKGKGELLNALRSMTSAEQAGERAELKERHLRERKALQQKYLRWPDYEEWLAEKFGIAAAGEWRYRLHSTQYLAGDIFKAPVVSNDIRDFVAEMCNGQVLYRRVADDTASFSDGGKQIEIFDWRDEAATLAALQLAAAKWGKVKVVDGDPEYTSMIIQLAVRHGIQISNPELEAEIAAERVRQRAEIPMASLKDGRVNAPVKTTAPRLDGLVSTESAFAMHARDLQKRHRDTPVDSSRLDAMVAVRMRVTGHSQPDIEAAVLEFANQRAKAEHRDWVDYAKRTSAYAFGVAGSKEVFKLEKYRDRLMAVEAGKSDDQENKLELT